MIIQTASTRFSDASRITVPLTQPTQPGTRLVMAVRADKACALAVGDPGGAARFWRCANTIGATHTWHRYPTPLSSGSSVEIQAATEITGSVLLLEVARLSVVDALQLLADLLAGSPGEPGGVR